MNAAEKNVVLTGTGFGDCAVIIRKHCREGASVSLRREPENPHDSKAIAAYLQVPGFMGFGSTWKKIGYVKAGRNKGLSERMDGGAIIKARIRTFYAPSGRQHPRVSLLVSEE